MDSLLLERPNQTSSGYEKPLDINLDFLAGSYKSKTLLANLEVIDEDIIANLDKVLEIKPDLYEAWYNRSIALVNLGSLEEAIANLDKALAIKPDLYEAWFNQGIILGCLEQPEEALASYDKALEIRPNKYQAWFNRGITLYDLGCLEDAILKTVKDWTFM
ncbi:tetratricopeptide repeat protein [Nostoc sp.]|uniref:tetratricopeptide repeat protein n=1 Tax=Nostoc sp. TaxID=1180 RepID=UPI002FF5DCE0